MKIATIILYLGWVSGVFGAILMLAGVIGFLIGGEFLNVRNFFNYFFIAIPFLLLGIFCLVGTRAFCTCNCNDESCCSDKEK
ncbi:MAG: hypothetical protein K0B08_12615 [Bacteroidales bacterium]|nr:hypothetical protein [Bacteroidales bacterium]